MTGVALPGGALNTMSYHGDGKRRRYEDSGGTRIFLWDGESIARQSDAGATTNRRYTLKPAGYGELISQDDSFQHGVHSERGRGDGCGCQVSLGHRSPGRGRRCWSEMRAGKRCSRVENPGVSRTRRQRKRPAGPMPATSEDGAHCQVLDGPR